MPLNQEIATNPKGFLFLKGFILVQFSSGI